MGKIKLIRINKNNNELFFEYNVSNSLKKYFTNIPFKIQYPDNIELVPDSIACIPFICNVLPIIWITDSILEVEEIDKTFYENIMYIKKGYVDMFPETDFLGKIKTNNIVDNDFCTKNNKTAMFFSGGLDSYQTLISHLDERPVLLSIWGSDIKYDNISGWEMVHNVIDNVAKQYNLEEKVIKSTFREFDAESALNRDFSKQLKDNWWHGVKHGIGLLGHVAPYSWLHNISTMYIASTYTNSHGKIRCASYPTIDNYVKFSGCKVVHDGFEYSRQNKIFNLVNYCKNNNTRIKLHVCWQSQDGNNCCKCEKCYRTIAGIWAEGENPENFGFLMDDKFNEDMKYYLFRNLPNFSKETIELWKDIQKRLIENKRYLKYKPFYKHIRWLISIDFQNISSLKMPLNYRVRTKLSKYSFYQTLHNLKNK